MLRLGLLFRVVCRQKVGGARAAHAEPRGSVAKRRLERQFGALLRTPGANFTSLGHTWGMVFLASKGGTSSRKESTDAYDASHIGRGGAGSAGRGHGRHHRCLGCQRDL